jgi:hypothetical protein
MGLPVQSALALSLIVVVIALFWLRFSSVPSVSAREILSRAERAEAQRIAMVREPIVHQQLKVTRQANGQPPQSTYLEIWHDPKNNRWREQTESGTEVSQVSNANSEAARTKSRKRIQRASHPWVAELQEILKANSMHQQPVSATAFAHWRSTLKKTEERVTETSLDNGDRALTIATSAVETLANNAIVKAEFVVRVQDWHPVQHRLSVSQPSGLSSYDIRETSFEVVTLGSVGTSIFEQEVLPPPLPFQASSPDRSPDSRDPVDALELEIALFQRLHQAGACLGEQVQIVRGKAAKPEVRGVVETLERKQELTRLFAAFPGVPVVLEVPAGKETGSTAGSGTLEVPASEETATQSDSPIKDQLLAYFAQLNLTAEARRTRSTEFSNLVITQSQLAYSHAWALRHLAERFDALSLQELSPSAVAELQSMAQDHLRALAGIIGRCDAMLRPVLISLGSPEDAHNAMLGSLAEGKTWASGCMRVFESVMNADRLMHGLFAGTGLTSTVQESSSALLAGFPVILEHIRVTESRLSGLVSLSGRPVRSSQSAQASHRE